VLLSSDAVRREMRFAPGDRYTDSAKAATYQQLLARAERAMQHGESVIADATWGESEMRALAQQTAAATASTLVALECTAPIEVAAARAQQRLERGGDRSEAGPEVARKLAADRSPWPGATGVDTTGDAEQALTHALTAIKETQLGTV
jgi:predicted kinase